MPQQVSVTSDILAIQDGSGPRKGSCVHETQTAAQASWLRCISHHRPQIMDDYSTAHDVRQSQGFIAFWPPRFVIPPPATQTDNTSRLVTAYGRPPQIDQGVASLNAILDSLPSQALCNPHSIGLTKAVKRL